MIAHAWILAAALVVPPVPPGTRPDPGEQALALYDRGAYLEAAAAASAGYLSPSEPRARRLQHARLAQEALAKAFETADPPRPEYLCRALDVLDATAPLALDPDDIKRHRALTDARRATLAARHPEHVCEVGTELRPIQGLARAAPPAPLVLTPVPPAPPVTTDTKREHRAPLRLTIAGAVSLTLGVAALAVMAGGLVVRSRAIKAADPLLALHEQQGVLLFAQGRELAALTDAATTGQRTAIAGGISSAVFVVLGAALIGRAHIPASRARVAPMASPGRAGLIVEGRF